VLETAAGSGIVTRALRDALPAGAHVTAMDLNPAMLDVARAKFRAGEDVVFQAADAMDLPFFDGSFDTMVCQFGVIGQGQGISGGPSRSDPRRTLSVQRVGCASLQHVRPHRA
jgi:SAM-dependent methyltransferase